MGDLLSRRQLETVASFKKEKLTIHCGPYGCGKSYSLALALGMACRETPPPNSDGQIALVGKTQATVKTNICGPLNVFFGDNFKYDSSRKDGFSKDATLFGHRIKLIGLFTQNAEANIRGLNTYKILGDEVSTWSEANFRLLLARIRGGAPEGWTRGFVGSTNPDGPKHWLKQTIDSDPGVRYVAWSEFDRVGPDARQYYADLRQRYANSPAYLARYVGGQWAAPDDLVYTEFRHDRHVLEPTDFSMDDFVSFKLGIDFGTTNATAILLVGVTKQKEHVVIEEHYLTENVTVTRVCNIIRDLNLRYRIRVMYIDPAAKVLISELKSLGFLNIGDADNSVLSGIDYVKDLFAAEMLFISSSCTNLILELASYQYSDKDGVNVIKQFDHAVDALRYVLYSSRGRLN